MQQRQDPHANSAFVDGSASPQTRRGWFRRHKVLTTLLALAAIVIVAAIAGSGGGGGDAFDTDSQGSPQRAMEASQRLFPNRPDAQEDQEREIGQAARIGDYEATVTSAAFQQSISEFESAGYIVLDVTVKNTGSNAHPYNTFDWKLQTPGGQVIDPYFGGDQLGSGDIVGGGIVTGRIIFEVKDQKGDFYSIYKPDAFDAARGIWKTTA